MINPHYSKLRNRITHTKKTGGSLVAAGTTLRSSTSSQDLGTRTGTKLFRACIRTVLISTNYWHFHQNLLPQQTFRKLDFISLSNEHSIQFLLKLVRL